MYASTHPLFFPRMRVSRRLLKSNILRSSSIHGAIAGHPIVREHAMVPIVDGIGLSISAISHDDRVDLTLVADRDLVPDLTMLADRFEIELDELHRMSRARQRRAGRRKRAS